MVSRENVTRELMQTTESEISSIATSIVYPMLSLRLLCGNLCFLGSVQKPQTNFIPSFLQKRERGLKKRHEFLRRSLHWLVLTTHSSLPGQVSNLCIRSSYYSPSLLPMLVMRPLYMGHGLLGRLCQFDSVYTTCGQHCIEQTNQGFDKHL